jgi:hypothetical protein
MSRRNKRNHGEKNPVAGRSERETACIGAAETLALAPAQRPKKYHRWLFAGAIFLQIAWIAYLVVLAVKN